MSELLRRYDEPRAVLVRDRDGTWWPGFCEGWVQTEPGLWRASVTYTTGVGQTHVSVVSADRVRPAGQ